MVAERWSPVLAQMASGYFPTQSRSVPSEVVAEGVRADSIQAGWRGSNRL